MSGTGNDNDEIRKITEFVDVTQCSPDEAQEYLAQSDWSVEVRLVMPVLIPSLGCLE
jgi:N-acetylmuramic acid 6-phosphate (MurNAc-6-P) etherase